MKRAFKMKQKKKFHHFEGLSFLGGGGKSLTLNIKRKQHETYKPKKEEAASQKGKKERNTNRKKEAVVIN